MHADVTANFTEEFRWDVSKLEPVVAGVLSVTTGTIGRQRDSLKVLWGGVGWTVGFEQAGTSSGRCVCVCA